MTSEYKTLRDLDVKPGDVVADAGTQRVVHVVGDAFVFMRDGTKWARDEWQWRLISRAPRDDAPKLWRGWQGGHAPVSGFCDVMWANGDIDEDRDAEEIGWLWRNLSDDPAECIIAYRPCARRKPKVETETLYGVYDGSWSFGTRVPEDTHRLTLSLIDGDIPAGTYTSADGHKIEVEALGQTAVAREIAAAIRKRETRDE